MYFCNGCPGFLEWIDQERKLLEKQLWWAIGEYNLYILLLGKAREVYKESEGRPIKKDDNSNKSDALN